MKSFLKQAVATNDSIEQPSKNKASQGKLYVAYRNNAMSECYGMASDPGNNYENNTRNYKESVFSTTGGSYYINGVPAILWQDDEAMLYAGELEEYY
jgi:hypothetical protein